MSDLKSFIKNECRKYNISLPKNYDAIKIPLKGILISHKLDLIKKIAETNGGKCLTKTWLGNITPHNFQCKNNHVWKARPNDIKRGHWCPECFQSKRGYSQRLSIDKMREIAANHGGLCLSKTYVNVNKKNKWQCAMGHQW